MPISARAAIHGVKRIVASGKSGRQKRTKPYVPIFSRTAARITEPPVGAATWASGSQVWNGKIGTLMAKASANARKSHVCRFAARFIFWSAIRSNVPPWE